MKGYIYITGQGADPHMANDLKDPILSRTPTLGACMPNIRRFVTRGDWVFVVSGKRSMVQQYVVGGFKVDEKITALAALERFPDNRLHIDDNGRLRGNIIVQPDGTVDPLDTHDPESFVRRTQNYIIGTEPIVMESDREVERSRVETLRKLSEIVERAPGNRVVDVIGRGAKRLEERQVNNLVDWLQNIKQNP